MTRISAFVVVVLLLRRFQVIIISINDKILYVADLKKLNGVYLLKGVRNATMDDVRGDIDPYICSSNLHTSDQRQ